MSAPDHCTFGESKEIDKTGEPSLVHLAFISLSKTLPEENQPLQEAARLLLEAADSYLD